MPNCFALIRKSDPEKGHVPLNTIDEEMCQHFNVPCDPKQYYYEWYSTIGFALAMGKSFQQQMERCKARIEEASYSKLKDEWKHELTILEWLDANFTADAWAER